MLERKKIKVVVGSPPKEEIWELCNENYSYCPSHGECPDVLDPHSPRDANGVVVYEIVRQFVIETMFFCKECGMVKMINVWNNCSGLTEGKLIQNTQD